MQSQLKISTWNTRGMSAAIPQIRALFKFNDFVSISEHWLHENKLNFLGEITDTFSYIARASKFSKGDTYGAGRG